MGKYIIFIIFLYTVPLYGQKTDSISVRIKKIESKISILQDSIKILKGELSQKKQSLNIAAAREKNNQTEISSIKQTNPNLGVPYSIKTVLKEDGYIKELPRANSTNIGLPKRGDTLIIVDCVKSFDGDTYYKIKDGGYIFKVYIETNNELNELEISANQKDIIDKKEKSALSEKERKEFKAKLTKRFGATNAEKLLNGYIWIGMTSEMFLVNHSEPDEINRSVGTWGTHEQWIYRSIKTYYYFDNGKLTSWQD